MVTNGWRRRMRGVSNDDDDDADDDDADGDGDDDNDDGTDDVRALGPLTLISSSTRGA